ncbi:MFS general substrate transporter [Microthyrium microscopicum]|uniref:Autophagy-related protein n=1 Tax=Microthyrium microscopicum TaxID=703497 RepID=A0A6A6TWN6_9PEZI|nr:MFS general substrate transporter [Microthyrium microscopicum]
MSASHPTRQQTNERTSSKTSSTSNEADDERSWASPPTMGPNKPRGVPQYDGEDTRQTSEKELRGFYAYGWASEVFVICGMGSFIPITLEQLARERGVLSTDHTTPCVTGLEPSPHGKKPIEAPQCILHILGTEINTASFAMYTFSISVLLQSLLIISMSGAADHGTHRKTLLLTFAWTGAIATMLFLPLNPDMLLVASLMAIIANTCYGASSVLLNSFLPVLVRNHPQVLAEKEFFHNEVTTEDNTPETNTPDGTSLVETSLADATTPLLPSGASTPPNEQQSIELSISTKVSSYGIGIGYIAALLLQTGSIIVIKTTGSSLFSLRLVLFIIGLWWAAFTFPSALWLRPRPGPPMHLPPSAGTGRTLLAYAVYSWKSLARSIMRARKLKDVLIFLAAWLLLSDAIATVSGTAVLFAKTSLQMRPAALALINVIVTISGIVGAFTWRRLSHIMGLKPHQTVLTCIVLFEAVPLYGLMGYLPIVKRWGVGGLQQGWEMYPVGAVYGFVLGGLSSFCRSLFGELVPPGFEAAFYALYAITDKGSSIFGPAIVGLITDATGHIRPAFFFLAALIAAPFPLLMMVDVERGKRDGIALAKELESAQEPWDDDVEDASRPLLES